MKLTELKTFQEERWKDEQGKTHWTENRNAPKNADGFLTQDEDIITWLVLHTKNLGEHVMNNAEVNVALPGVQKASSRPRVSIENGEAVIHETVKFDNIRVKQLPVKFKFARGFDFEKSGDPLDNLKGMPAEIHGDFNVSDKAARSLEHGPVNVSGNYWCYTNDLSTLKGAPIRIGSPSKSNRNVVFNCSDNLLTTLEGGPDIVYCDYDCSGNMLTSLKGAPSDLHGYFDCSSNSALESFEYVPREMTGFYCHDTGVRSFIGIADLFDAINGKFVFSSKDIENGGLGLLNIKGLTELLENAGSLTKPFQIIKKYIGHPERLFDCQAELIEEGFEEYAEL